MRERTRLSLNFFPRKSTISCVRLDPDALFACTFFHAMCITSSSGST